MKKYKYRIKTVDEIYHITSVDPCESSEEGLGMLLNLEWIPTEDHRHINRNRIIYIKELNPDKEE